MRGNMKVLWLFVICAALVGCDASTQKSQTDLETPNHKLLREQGYTNITLKGWVPFKCSEDDNVLYTDAFEATGPKGDMVTGTICGGILKGKTIRFN